jgi:hypothetical protein
MGLLSDTLEDNRERCAQIETTEFVPLESPPPTLPHEISCTVCDRVFGGDLAMQNHIRVEHAKEYIYIRMNERVVRSMDYFDEPLKCCHVSLIGIDSVSLEIETGSGKRALTLGSSADLMPHLPSDATGEFRITVYYGSVERQFLIYFQTKPPFDAERLNAEVSNLQRQLDQGDEPDWKLFQYRKRRVARNPIETQYLNGFFEYSLGFHMEKIAPSLESGKHLETAMQLLRPYCTSMALTARRILAIRMNCFAALKKCEDGSVFYPSRLFFVDNERTLPALVAVGIKTGDGSVYVDGFTKLLLIAIEVFYARDKLNLFELIEHLAKHPLADDKNNEDKILLLKARAHHVYRDDKKARPFYDRLLYHPAFGQEAQKFCHETGVK